MEENAYLKYPYQENIIKNLENIIKNNALANAYIFHGPEGIGKKEVAFKFINKLLNRNNCDFQIDKRIRENNHPDFSLIEPISLQKSSFVNRAIHKSNNTKNIQSIIRVDQIRNLRSFISKKSIESEKKIVLINDAHLLNEASSNCLLKTLEEPTNGLFILLTAEMNLLLDTIISRCQKVRFKTYSNQELKEFIKTNKSPELNQKIYKIEELIYLSNGSPGKLIENIKTWNTISSDIKEKINFPIKDISEVLILSRHINEELDNYQQDLLINYVQLIWWKKIKNREIIQILEDLKQNLQRNIQPRLSWEVSLLKITLTIYPTAIG